MKLQEIQREGIDKNPEQLLYSAIAVIKTPSEAEKFFTDLCTPTELQAMADRWRVVALVKEGMSYRKIHEETGVSVTTIGRVARYLTLGSGGYEIIYKRLEKQQHDSIIATKNRRSKKRASK